MTARWSKARIAGMILLLPHVLLTLLAALNVVHDIGLLDLTGQRALNITTGAIVLGGEALTCVALWRPGRFTALGPLARVRVLATIWNLLNACWLSYLVLHRAELDRLQMGEMALAYVTLCALMIFAIEPKK